MSVLHSKLLTIRFFSFNAYLSLLFFLEISWAGLPLSCRTVLSWWPMVPLGPGGFLPHLDCPRAPFSVPSFASSSLLTWDLCLRLGLSSVSLMLTIYRLTSTARQAVHWLHELQRIIYRVA